VTLRSEAAKGHFTNLSVVHWHERDARTLTASYSTDRVFAFAIRNPIRRFISAFYHQSFLPQKVSARRRFYERFGNASAFAEALYSTSGRLDEAVLGSFASNEHIRCNLDFYMARFLATIPPAADASRNIVVITQEALARDVKVGLNVTIKDALNANPRSRCLLVSERALANLRRFLEPDYAVIERLNELGVLMPAQYAVLSDPVCTQESEWCTEC
jgi:hypothetical protein